MTAYTTTHGKHEASPVTHFGRIVTLTGNRLVTKSDTGREQLHTVAHDVRVTCDGKPCHVEDLKLGASVRVSTRKDDENIAIGIECVRRD